MINFLEAVKHQLHQFVETGHSKPVHLMQNQLINDIYHADIQSEDLQGLYQPL